MTRSPDCEEYLVLDEFWPFVEKLEHHPVLSQWDQCSLATSKREILTAEKALWYRLPESYKLFLLAWNGFNTPGEGKWLTREIAFYCCLDFAASAESPRVLDAPQLQDIVRGNSLSARCPEQPGDMLDFARDMHGNRYGFQQAAGAEPRVVYWNHDGLETTALAADFKQWLNALPETLAGL